MIDVRAEIEKTNSDFINIHDFIGKVRSQVKGTLPDICIWIIQEITSKITIPEISPVGVYEIDEFYRVTPRSDHFFDELDFIERKFKLVINNKLLPISSDEDSDIPFDWVDNDFFRFGFSIKELQSIFPATNLSKAIQKPLGWGEYAPPSPIESAVIDTPAEHSPNIEWSAKFAGRTAALDIIGAISKILVEKSGNKYLHGENVSANAIADSVVEMMDTINKNKSTENYRKLIGEALKISGPSTEE